MKGRLPLPRAAVERMRELLVIRATADAELAGIQAGIAWASGIPPGDVRGFDDGPEPALLFSSPLEDPAMTDETTAPPPEDEEPEAEEPQAEEPAAEEDQPAAG